MKKIKNKVFVILTLYDIWRKSAVHEALGSAQKSFKLVWRNYGIICNEVCHVLCYYRELTSIQTYQNSILNKHLLFMILNF